MTRKTKKIILFSILTLAVAGTAWAWYLYNKGPVDVKGASPYAQFIAENLYQSVIVDSAAANKKYREKILEVTGFVSSIEIHTDGKVFIKLKTNEASASINCEMEGSAETIKELDSVKIKGIYTGLGEGIPDMGISGDVYLARCYITK